MLILEATERDKEKYWQFGCARLTHGSVRVNFDDREVWSVDSYENWDPASPYYRLTPHERRFGAIHYIQRLRPKMGVP